MLGEAERCCHEVRFAALRHVNVSKCVCGRGSGPDPAGAAYSAPPDLLAGFGEGNMEWKGLGRERERKERRGEESRGKGNGEWK